MTLDELRSHLLRRLAEVQARLGAEQCARPDVPFGRALDSMGFVEFLGCVASDCGADPLDIEEAVSRRYTDVAGLAEAMWAAGIVPGIPAEPAAGLLPASEQPGRPAWLAATAVELPDTRLRGGEIDAMLGRPEGWFTRVTRIHARCVWAEADPLDAAARAARRVLAAGGERPGVLLVTSETPPLPAGLAAGVHHRLGLSASCPALEVGGACVGLLHALWLGQRLVSEGNPVLVVAAEAPARWLRTEPGPAGEAAALFGDAAGACLISSRPPPGEPLRLVEVALACDAAAADLLRVRCRPGSGIEVGMRGPALAGRAVHLLARAVREMAARGGWTPADLAAVAVHAGNGRMPALVARELGLEERRVVSRTAETGNLGSVSLLAAWEGGDRKGPAIWAAVGAGLNWGAALLEGEPPPAN